MITFYNAHNKPIKVRKAAAEKYGVKQGQKGVTSGLVVKICLEDGRIEREEREERNKKANGDH